MLNKGLFKKPKIELESNTKNNRKNDPNIPYELCSKCPSCKTMSFTSDLEDNHHICPKCGFHYRINARQRIEMITDSGSFKEHDQDHSSENPLDFPGYHEKLQQAKAFSHENEGVVTGVCEISGEKACIFVMDASFMMGSMGQVVGEKITRIFEYATENVLPVVGFTVSGGARMQEGMLSLMQMAKTSGAVKRHNDQGNLYIVVLTDPTTGGVTASFAMEGDIILSEPEALVAFAGPRVIEQTIRQRLPKGFQKSEFLLEKGFIDGIVPRNLLKKTLKNILSLHSTKESGEPNGSL